jgi:putative FmdB family regulatory protein
MPTYGYHCPRCQTDFEVLQRMTDEPGADCPTCGTRARRLFYPTGIVFKGSGFYKTDSRTPASAGAGGSGRVAASGPKEASATDGSAGDGSAASPAKEGKPGGSKQGKGAGKPAAGEHRGDSQVAAGASPG